MSTNIVSRKNYEEFIKTVTGCKGDESCEYFYIAECCSIYGIKSIYMDANREDKLTAAWINNHGMNGIIIEDPMSEAEYYNAIDTMAESIKEKGMYIFIQIDHGSIDLKYFDWNIDDISFFSWPWRAEIKSENPIESDGTYLAMVSDIRWEDEIHRIYVIPITKLPADSISKNALRHIIHDERISLLYRDIHRSSEAYAYSYPWSITPYFCHTVPMPTSNGKPAKEILDEIIAGSFDFIKYNDSMEGNKETNAFVVKALKIFHVSYPSYPNLSREISCPSLDQPYFNMSMYDRSSQRPSTVTLIKNYYSNFMSEYCNRDINDLPVVEQVVNFLKYIETCLEVEVRLRLKEEEQKLKKKQKRIAKLKKEIKYLEDNR